MRGDSTLAVVVVDLACCSVEIAAAVTQGVLIPDQVTDPEPTLRVLVVAGTVTLPMADALQAAWGALPGPKAAVAFGACACTGGPYWDAPSVSAGVDPSIPVSRYVIGCPPRPTALEQALLAVRVEVLA